MAQVRARLQTLPTAMLAAGISLLSACGGGGSSGGNTDAQATPQAVSSAYTALETRSLSSGTGQTQLQIVDIRNGAIARRYDLPAAPSASEYPTAFWATIFQASVDANGLGFQQTGASQLAIIQSGKLMLLDLAGNALGTARQISNVTDACRVDRRITYLSADGRHAWLRIWTAGPDHNCSTTTDNPISLVSTDMLTGDAPVASGLSAGLHIVAALRDVAGQASNVLVLDRDRHALAVYTNDLKTKRYDVPVTAQALSGTEAARVLVDSPVSYNQALVQLGSDVYLADWTSGTLALGAPIIANLRAPLANSTAPVVTISADRYYLGDGVKGYAISSSGQLLADFTFPAERGDIVEAVVTNYGVIVNQTVNSGSASAGSTSPAGGPPASTAQAAVATTPVSTLWSVNGSNGSYTNVSESTGTAPFSILAVRGDTVWFSQLASTNSIWSTVYKISATNSFAPQTVASGVQLVDYVRNSHATNGLYRVDKVLWCTPTPASTVGCANGSVSAYDMTSAQPALIGTMAASEATTIGSKLFGVHEFWTGRNGLINLVRFSANGNYSSDVWLLNPDASNSLQRLTPLP